MTRRSFLASLLALLLALVPTAAIAQAPPRIVAIGDLHGDWAAWRAIASAAGLIDAKGRWTGGKTILVQTGDVPDRGPDTLKIIDDLIAANPGQAAAVKEKPQAIGWFVGQVMKATGGKANPGVINGLLKGKLGL